MIATVKIAPMERWCAPNKAEDIQLTCAEKCSLIVGLPINIDTAKMWTDEACNGKAWYMTKESAYRIDVLLDRHEIDWSNTPAFICEHMLEMD